ncbi:MAG: hypothetical protein ACOYOK_12075 [Pseudobdellovibrionaceae bacterium]
MSVGNINSENKKSSAVPFIEHEVLVEELKVSDFELLSKTNNADKKLIIDITKVKSCSTVDEVKSVIFKLAEQFLQVVIIFPPFLQKLFGTINHKKLMMIVKIPAISKLDAGLSLEECLQQLSFSYFTTLPEPENYAFALDLARPLEVVSEIDITSEGEKYILILATDVVSLQRRFEATYAPFDDDLNYTSVCSEHLNNITGRFKETVRISGYGFKFGIPIEKDHLILEEDKTISKWVVFSDQSAYRFILRRV